MYVRSCCSSLECLTCTWCSLFYTNSSICIRVEFLDHFLNKFINLFKLIHILNVVRQGHRRECLNSFEQEMSSFLLVCFACKLHVEYKDLARACANTHAVTVDIVLLATDGTVPNSRSGLLTVSAVVF